MSTSQERDFIRGVIRLQRPTIVVEVGVATGGMACAILNATATTHTILVCCWQRDLICGTIMV